MILIENKTLKWNLDDLSLNALIRIRMNGPDIEKFPSMDYAKYWITIQDKLAVDDVTDTKENIKDETKVEDEEKFHYDKLVLF